MMVASLVIIVATVILVHSRLDQSQAAPALQGTSLGEVPAPAFTLTDQSGAPVSLSALKGRPVVLVFMYTHCPDECPITAELLHTTTQKLGAAASRVAWIAVSVDPAGDTPQAATAFVAAHHLTGYMRFLLGSRAQLAPLWHAYGIVPEMDPFAASNGAEVNHGLGVFVLDGQGRERIYLGYPFDPSILSADLHALLAE
jgi:protein SCO1